MTAAEYQATLGRKKPAASTSPRKRPDTPAEPREGAEPAETVYYQQKTGASGLDTFKAFHLQPQQVARLREVVEQEFGARRC